jgi:hypothetical protein
MMMDLDLLSYGPSAVAAPVGPLLKSVMGSSSMQRSTAAIDAFVRSWADDETLLNSQLYEPALGDAGTGEQLPVVLLRDVAPLGSLRLRSSSGSSGSGAGKFLGRLPRISLVGLAAPEGSKLVDQRIVGAYVQLADRVEQLSAGFGGGTAQQQQHIGQQYQLKLQHFSQIVFGRLDLAVAHASMPPSLQQCVDV